MTIPIARRAERARRVPFEPERAQADDAARGDPRAEIRRHGAEILADDDRAMPERFERGEPQQIVARIAQVRAVARRRAVAHHPQPREAEHVIDANASRVREARAQTFDERREAPRAQRRRRPRGDAPCLAARVERIGGRADRQAAQHRIAVPPRVAARRVAADRQVRDQADRHAAAARGALRGREPARGLPLQEGVERDVVRVRARERGDVRRIGRAPCGRPTPPVRADAVVDAARLQRVERRMCVERAGVPCPKARERPRARIRARGRLRAPAVEQQAQHAQLRRHRAGPIDERRARERAPLRAEPRIGDRRARRVRAEHRFDVDVGGVAPKPRRRRVRAVMLGQRGEGRLRRADRERVRAAPGGGARAGGKRGEIADAAVGLAAQPVELRREAPRRRAFAAAGRRGAHRVGGRPCGWRRDGECCALLAGVEHVVAGRRERRQHGCAGGLREAAGDGVAVFEGDPVARAGASERGGQRERRVDVARHEPRRGLRVRREPRGALGARRARVARVAERVEQRREHVVADPPREARCVDPVRVEPGRVRELDDRRMTRIGGHGAPSRPFTPFACFTAGMCFASTARPRRATPFTFPLRQAMHACAASRASASASRARGGVSNTILPSGGAASAAGRASRFNAIASVLPSPRRQRATSAFAWPPSAREHRRAERARAVEPRRDEARAHGERAAVEAPPRVRVGRLGARRGERRAGERRRVVRVGNRVAMGGIGERGEGGEFAAAAFAHRCGERAAMIGEELERLRRAAFLAHEQQRNLRRKQRERARRAQRVVVHERAQPLAECAVADLIVVLQERDERARRQVRARFAARCAAVQRRRLALIRETFAEHAREVADRRVGIRAVVARLLARQQHVHAVVEIVVPLRVEAAAGEQARGVAFVFEHEMHVARVARVGAHAAGEAGEPRVVADRVRGVDPQSVEPVFVEPVQRVLEKERARLRAREIDGRPPCGIAVAAEERGRVAGQQVAVGAEVVVDDVEQHLKPEPVRGVDERLQRVGRPVGCVGRERQHAVVAPVARAGERVDGHQLDRGDAERGERREPARDPRIAAERADVHLVQHGFAPRPSAPVVVAPAVGGRIDDLARAVHAVRLEARRGIGHAQRAV